MQYVYVPYCNVATYPYNHWTVETTEDGKSAKIVV